MKHGQFVKHKPVDLGELQNGIEASAKELKSAQKAFQNASDRLSLAQDSHNQAIIGLNQGLATIKSINFVPNLMAK